MRIITVVVAILAMYDLTLSGTVPSPLSAGIWLFIAWSIGLLSERYHWQRKRHEEATAAMDKEFAEHRRLFDESRIRHDRG